jgi:hypothetical protein
MFSCTLCEVETVYITSLCQKCRRIKHLLNLYQERVYEVLEEVLVRKEKQQEHKIKNELVKEKKTLEEFEKKVDENVKTRLRNADKNCNH